MFGILCNMLPISFSATFPFLFITEICFLRLPFTENFTPKYVKSFNFIKLFSFIRPQFISTKYEIYLKTITFVLFTLTFKPQLINISLAHKIPPAILSSIQRAISSRPRIISPILFVFPVPEQQYNTLIFSIKSHLSII